MGVSFDAHICALRSRKGITEEERDLLTDTACDQGFAAYEPDEEGVVVFEFDSGRQDPGWDTFFVRFGRLFAVGCQFSGTNGDGFIYGYRIEEDGVVLLDGKITYEDLTTLTLEIFADEARSICRGRQHPVSVATAGSDGSASVLTYENLSAALAAPLVAYGSYIEAGDGGWVMTTYGARICLTAPRSALLAAMDSAEGEVRSAGESLGDGVGGGDAEAREYLDPGEGGTPQE